MSEVKRYAMINANGAVYDVAMWDGESDWSHDAAQVIQSDEAGIGWVYVDGEFKMSPALLRDNSMTLRAKAPSDGV